MQNVSNESQRVSREVRSPEPMQLDDWENEGGAPPVTGDDPPSFFARIERAVVGASKHVANQVRTRPLATLGAVFALGLAAGGGMRYLKSGRLLMAIAARPLFALATAQLVKK
jgi:hypothetical protein